MPSLLIKSIINLICLVRWVLRLSREITQKIPSHPQPLSCPASLKPPTGSHIYQRRRWHLFLLLLPCGRWVLMPLSGENCHPPSYLSGPGEKHQSCRAGIALGFSFLTLMPPCCQDTASVLQLHRSTVWMRKHLEQALPPETPLQLVLPHVSFPFQHVSVLLNYRVSQFGKTIMEAE